MVCCHLWFCDDSAGEIYSTHGLQQIIASSFTLIMLYKHRKPEEHDLLFPNLGGTEVVMRVRTR